MQETRTGDDTGLLRAVLRHFATSGQAPSPDDVGASEKDFARLSERHALVLSERGAIVFANPFAAGPSEYTVRTATGTWHAICAWDALGILAALPHDGTIESLCPDCGGDLSLEVAGGSLVATSAVAHFLVPAADWYRDLVFT